MKIEKVKSEAANLIEVGRAAEAMKVKTNHLESISNFWLKNAESIQDPSLIKLYTKAILEFSRSSVEEEHKLLAALNMIPIEKDKRLLLLGVDTFRNLIEANNKKLFVDATILNFNLGKIYHQIRTETENELWAYHAACEAITPQGCKFPASVFDKIIAHHYGSMCAFRIGNKEHEDWHNYKKRLLAPAINWDDNEAATKWILENQ